LTIKDKTAALKALKDELNSKEKNKKGSITGGYRKHLLNRK